MSQRIVRITLSNQETVALRGKLADMIYWIARNQHHIDAIQQGELTFNWSQNENGTAGTFRPTVRNVLPSEKFSA